MMKLIQGMMARLAMEFEIACVWSGVGETVAGLPPDQRSTIFAACEAKEAAIRAKYSK